MNYIKLEENTRIGYKVSVNYLGYDYIKDLVSYNEILKDNLYTYTKYTSYDTNGIIDIELLIDRLSEQVSTLEVIKKHRLAKNILEEIKLEMLFEEEWEELVGNRTTDQVLGILIKNDNELRELRETLTSLKISEVCHYKEIIFELIEENKINSLLNNMKVIQGVWRGSSQEDYKKYFSLIKYDTEEERVAIENRVDEKFSYLNMILNRDNYDITIRLERQVEDRVWIMEKERYCLEKLIDQSEIKKFIKEQAKEITNKKYHEQIEDEKLNTNIIKKTNR